MDALASIRATFFQECEEQLSELETGLMAMEAGDAEPDTVNAVFRAVHSIKGGAGAFALDALVRFAHVFETTLDDVRSERLAVDVGLLKVMLRAADVLADLVRAARDGGAPDEARGAAIAVELAALRGPGADGPDADDGMDDIDFQPVLAGSDPAEADEREWHLRLTPNRELYAKGNETALLLRELSRLGTLDVTLDAAALPDLSELDPEGAYLTWSATLRCACDEAALRQVFEFVEEECALEIAADAPPAGPAASELDVMELIRLATAGAASAPAPSEAPARSTPGPATLPEAASDEAGAATGVPAARIAVPAAEPSGRPEGVPAAATIRVDLDRVDRLIDLVGELVINEAMLSQRVLEAGLARASGVSVALEELGQLTREIQDSVMAIRAQPVRSVFQRMPRLVREVAAITGKPVRLVMEGEATEVDKTVIERLADPLTHMIRNAIDHGLEAPPARRDAGKPAEGVVRLTALHRSGRIVIEVADDGGGIDRDRVRAKAVEKGLLSPDAQLTDEETDNLIFLPGFSTADAVSDLSGRGVGMDVVRRSVQALGGRISIASRPGEGSTFTLSLPLTLAVLDGMVVSVAGQTLIVPLGTIMETLQPRAADVHGLGETQVMAIRGGYVPLIDVGVALGYRAAPIAAATGVALLVEGEGGTRAVLLADAIQGQRQVVIKSLEANYGAVPGIAAATVMGDGRIALILDVDVIACIRRVEASPPAHARAEPSPAIGS